MVEQVRAGLDNGVDGPLGELSSLVGRRIDPEEVRASWLAEDPEDIARRLLHPHPAELPPIDTVQMVEVMSLIMDPVADPIEVERWAAGLARVTGDAAFDDLVYRLAPGPTPEDVIRWALARGQGRPVPLVKGPDGLWQVKGARGPLAGVPVLSWLKDPKAQADAPGLPATMRRLGAGLDDDADPDDILDHFRPKLPPQVMRMLEARIAIWSADQD